MVCWDRPYFTWSILCPKLEIVMTNKTNPNIQTFLQQPSKYIARTINITLIRILIFQKKLFVSMIAIQKWWKMLFISSYKLFSFSKYLNFLVL